MSREVMVRIWCDVCQHLESDPTSGSGGPANVEGTEVTVAFGATGKPKTLALCEMHEKDLYWPFFDVFRLYAKADPETRQASARAKASTESEVRPGQGIEEPGICPGCGEWTKARSSHWRDRHQDAERKTLAQALGIDAPHQCPTCPLAYTNGAGLAQHIRYGHHVAPAA